MDMIVTFDDGSSAYLEHHGIKGMKWGVWNEETRARRMGGGLSVRKKSGSSEASSSGSGGYKGPKLTDEQKAIMKKAAIGLGTAAAIGGGVYLAKKAADAGLDAKLANDLRKVRENEGARLATQASIVKENIFRDALDSANKTKDGINFKADRADINNRIKRDTQFVASTTRGLTRGFNSRTAKDMAFHMTKYGDRGRDVYRLVEASLDYRAASDKARANYAKGKKVIDTVFAAGKGAAIGTAVGTVLGTAANINASKNKTAISKTTEKKYTIKSTNPDPKKYEVWDPTLSKSENLEWNKEHKGN